MGSVEQDSGRFKVVWLVMGLGFLAIFIRLAYVQLINEQYYPR